MRSQSGWPLCALRPCQMQALHLPRGAHCVVSPKNGPFPRPRSGAPSTISGWSLTRLTRRPYPLQSRKNQTHRKPIYHGHFSAIEKISHATLRNRAVQHVAHFARFPQVARDGADVGSNAPHAAKTLVFLSRCSNANAVFAIPAGTDDIATHSRLGGQHGEEAKEDGEGSEKGRKKDQAPEEEVTARRASVFDFERRR